MSEPKKTYNPNWNWEGETRIWKAATSPERCQRLAKREGLNLVEVIDTGKDNPLPYICIFEENQT